MDGSGPFKKRIRSLMIRIGNNGGIDSSPATNAGRDTVSIGISKKKGCLCDQLVTFLIIKGILDARLLSKGDCIS